MIWTTIAYLKSVIGILTVWMLSRFLLCLRVLTKERITSVVVHHCFLPNNISCKPVTLFISNMLMDHLCSEAISFWGKVRECTPPSKRHLCNDDRLLHLWTEDCPFSFDSVQHLPMFIKVFSRQCVTISHDVSLLWLKGYFMLKISPLIFEYMTVHGIYLHL